MVNFFARLQQIKQMHVTAESLAGSTMGWNGQGSATVTTETESINGISVLHIIEEGQFKLNTQVKELPMMNAVCLHLLPEKIVYSHERHGRDSPVFLFDLVAVDALTLKSHYDHHCGKDRYSITVVSLPEYLYMHWRIIGPHKNESIQYYYVN